MSAEQIVNSVNFVALSSAMIQLNCYTWFSAISSWYLKLLLNCVVAYGVFKGINKTQVRGEDETFERGSYNAGYNWTGGKETSKLLTGSRGPCENDDLCTVTSLETSIDAPIRQKGLHLKTLLKTWLCAKGDKNTKTTSGGISSHSDPNYSNCGTSGRSVLIGSSCAGGGGGGNGCGGAGGDDGDEGKDKRKGGYPVQTDDEYGDEEEEEDSDEKCKTKKQTGKGEQSVDIEAMLSHMDDLKISKEEIRLRDDQGCDKKEMQTLPSACTDQVPESCKCQPVFLATQETLTCSYLEETSTNNRLQEDEEAQTADCEETPDNNEHPGLLYGMSCDNMDTDLPKINRKFTAAFYCKQRNEVLPFWTCAHEPCEYIHRMLEHGKYCRFKMVLNYCEECVDIIKIHIWHAHYCTERHCPVPTCAGIKLGVPPVDQSQEEPVFSGVSLTNRLCFQEHILDCLPIDSSENIYTDHGLQSDLDLDCASILSPLNTMYLTPGNDGQYRQSCDWISNAYLSGGQFGCCYYCSDNKTQRIFVAKKVLLSKFEQEEMNIHRDMSRITLDVVEFYGALKTEHHVFLFMEYMDAGSIEQVLSRVGPFNELHSLYVVQRVLLALERLHEYGIIHRDVKGANVLTDTSGLDVKLCDFGCSSCLPFGETQMPSGLQPTGTIYSMDPRVSRSEAYDVGVDIWGIGCFLIQMLSGKPPWVDHPGSVLFAVGTHGRPEIPECSPAVKEVFEACFREADNRPSAQLCLQLSAFQAPIMPPVFLCEPFKGLEECDLTDSQDSSSEQSSLEEDCHESANLNEEDVDCDNELFQLQAHQVHRQPQSLDEELQSLQDDLSVHMMSTRGMDAEELDYFDGPDVDPSNGEFTQDLASMNLSCQEFDRFDWCTGTFEETLKQSLDSGVCYDE